MSMLVVLIAQILIGGLSYASSTSSDTVLTASWDNASNDARTRIQNEFNCCGFVEFAVEAGEPCPTDSTEPCLQAMKEYKDQHMTNLATAGMAAAGIEVNGLKSRECGFIMRIC